MSSQAAEKVEEPTDENVAKPHEVAEDKPRPTPVIISRTGLEEEHSIRLRVNVSNEVTPEDCMDEAFWSHIGTRLTIGDTLIVRPDHMQWELVLHVANCGREFAHVVKKHFYELEYKADPRTQANRYSVDFAGSTDKWRMLRDGKVLKVGFASQGIALQAVKNHQMAVDRSK